MRNFTIFLKKELLESTRNYKLLILVIVFTFFGFLGPITAKYTPDIISSLMPKNMQISIADPTWVDSWMQFFKNTSQLGFVLIIAIFIGIMSKEFQNQTMINLVTKGVSRSAIILAKYMSSLVILTVAYLLSFIITALYTKIYFDYFMNSDILWGIFCLYIFYCFLLSLILFASTLSERESNSLLILFLLLTPMFILKIVPKAINFNPLTLLLNNMSIITGETTVIKSFPSILISIISTLIFIIASIQFFNKKEL